MMKKKVLALLTASALLIAPALSAHAAQTEEGQTAPAVEASQPVQTPPVQTQPGMIASDVKETDWYYNAVLTVLDASLMKNANGAFRPGEAMTRENIAAVLYRDAKSMAPRLMGAYISSGASAAPDYAQVSEEMREAVHFCYQTGIMTGDSNGNLMPLANVTREEMAALLQRYCAFTEIGKPAPAAEILVSQFQDYDAIQPWARESIAFCVENGVLKGNADGSYQPSGMVTRAECAQMLTNIMGLAAQ